ncbi:helix-turn-helix domain-containing protein [Elizabethkingia anophelis]|uniref:helix-turn-helix domain-containing protein n=1 Tax=Elizabethkingia anophelis TaxID=1117645 RepID=UPI00301CE8F4
MIIQTKQKLLKKLTEFEELNLFTRKKISLTYVANYCETNTRYLSNIIQLKTGSKGFNKYINDLRLEYIIKKLNEDPKYKNYKIAFLADDAGFSSANKFATIFKQKMSVSPSLYISSLNNLNYDNQG